MCEWYGRIVCSAFTLYDAVMGLVADDKMRLVIRQLRYVQQ